MFTKYASVGCGTILFVFSLWGVVGAKAATISDNLNAPTGYTELVSGTVWVAASFGSGSTPSTLSSVLALMQSDEGGTATLRLYSNIQQAPGAYLGALTPPTSFSSVLAPNTFGGAGLMLAANTTYWLVMQPVAGTTEWAYASDNTGSGSGFQHTWAISGDSGANWYVSYDQPMQMRVDVTGVPEIGANWMVGLGLLLVAAKRLLRREPSYESEQS